MSTARPSHWTDLETRYPTSPIHASLGLTLQVPERGQAWIHHDGAPGAANTRGNPSGALLAAMVDSAVMQAVLTQLTDDDFATTLELKINYLRSSPAGGALIARGTLEHVGRTTAVGIARIESADGTVIAMGTVTAAIRRSA
ncbi:PaaI family thioesterase [Aeromicrobium sp. P5_D10]